ncbi:hypothetical protein CN231_21215 [Sinorhizobium meliloti]|nr:hypothetical protein CN231_21215 [Sinorhizobium meliloti]
MTMMAVETTVLFPCSRYRNRPEICQSQKRALFRNIPANTAFNMRSYFRRLFSPLNFDWRTIACVGQLQRSIPSSGALIFFSRTIARRLQDPRKQSCSGGGWGPLQLRSRRFPSDWALALFHPREPLRTSLADILLSTEAESKAKRQLYRTLVWFINDKRLSRPAVRNLSTMSRVISSERHHWRPLASVIASELQSLSLRRSSEASRAGVSAPQIGHRRIFVDAGQRHSPTAGTECIQRRE